MFGTIELWACGSDAILIEEARVKQSYGWNDTIVCLHYELQTNICNIKVENWKNTYTNIVNTTVITIFFSLKLNNVIGNIVILQILPEGIRLLW